MNNNSIDINNNSVKKRDGDWHGKCPWAQPDSTHSQQHLTLTAPSPMLAPGSAPLWLVQENNPVLGQKQDTVAVVVMGEQIVKHPEIWNTSYTIKCNINIKVFLEGPGESIV